MEVLKLVRDFLAGESAANKLEDELRQLDDAEVRIALLGRSGTGK